MFTLAYSMSNLPSWQKHSSNIPANQYHQEGEALCNISLTQAVTWLWYHVLKAQFSVVIYSSCASVEIYK